jgi:hypothetical protein
MPIETEELARRIERLEAEMEAVKQRNVRVEADKRWETSAFRVGWIAAVTYVVSSLVLRLIGVERFFESALIPLVGYVLSTQTLPRLKQWWIERNCNGGA